MSTLGAIEKKLNRISFIEFFALLLFVVAAVISLGSVSQDALQFSFLAESFSHGRLYFVGLKRVYRDVFSFNGKLYWHLGPMPALLLVPFISVFSAFPQVYYIQNVLQLALNIGVFFLAYKLARKKFSHIDSVYLAVCLTFASVYHLIAFVYASWYVSHALTMLLGLWSLYEYKSRRRFWLIGVIYALCFATRFTAGFGVIFFYLLILFDKKLQIRGKAKRLLYVSVPILLVGFLLMLYNYTRFQDPLDNGYKYINNTTMSAEEVQEPFQDGLFNIKYIPTNIYYYFLRVPTPLIQEFSHYKDSYFLRFPYLTVSFPGVSFFVVSPVFLYLLRLKLKRLEFRYMLITCLVILFFLLSYYWPGWGQVGPRYLLDLMPFLYYLLLHSFKRSRLTLGAKRLIVISTLFNYYLTLNFLIFINSTTGYAY